MIVAIHDYHAALELDESLHRAREGLDRAKKLQKQSERRDYYKILGVSRQATKQEVVKAYRFVILHFIIISLLPFLKNKKTHLRIYFLLQVI